jgi:hypothetical protein
MEKRGSYGCFGGQPRIPNSNKACSCGPCRQVEYWTMQRNSVASKDNTDHPHLSHQIVVSFECVSELMRPEACPYPCDVFQHAISGECMKDFRHY